MITFDIAAGVHRVTSASTNLYLLEQDDAVTIVDAGLPRMWDETTRALRHIGRTWDAVAGIVLTHGHFDHVGILSRARAEHATPMWVHPGDKRIVQHPYRYRPGKPRLLYPFLHPRSIPHLSAMVRAGALHVRGVDAAMSLTDGQTVDLPGRLTVVATPGHTNGHCALVSRQHDIVFTGDALVTLDPYTGRTGPRIVAQGGTHDPDLARSSLDAIAATGVQIVAPGHGELWTDGAARAAAAAAGTALP